MQPQDEQEGAAEEEGKEGKPLLKPSLKKPSPFEPLMAKPVEGLPQGGSGHLEIQRTIRWSWRQLVLWGKDRSPQKSVLRASVSYVISYFARFPVPFSLITWICGSTFPWGLNWLSRLKETSPCQQHRLSKDDYLNLQCMSAVVVFCNLINSHVHSYAWLFLQKIYLEWNSFTQANMVPSIPNVRECQKRHAHPWLSDWLWWPNDASKVQS